MENTCKGWVFGVREMNMNINREMEAVENNEEISEAAMCSVSVFSLKFEFLLF